MRIKDGLLFIMLVLFLSYSAYFISEVAEVGTIQGWIMLNMPQLDLAKGCS